VIIATEDDIPRIVSGTPADPGTAAITETPGTVSYAMPAMKSAIASSPPRPNT
jgi:hypothetical protein